MMKLNRSFGGASLMMLLSSAVLCVLAVLSLSPAIEDYELSERCARSIERYYASYGECQRQIAAAGDTADAFSSAVGYTELRRDGNTVVYRYDIDAARYFEITVTPGEKPRFAVSSVIAEDESLWEDAELELWDGG